jgi:hypothetical protein
VDGNGTHAYHTQEFAQTLNVAVSIGIYHAKKRGMVRMGATMPNRIIRESIRESDSIDKLSAESEVMFYRLITYADDYGRFKADPRILNPALFPLKSYTDTQIINWLDEIGNTFMISFYKGTDTKLYGYFTNWHDYQQVRNKKSKYPEPNGNQFITVSLLLKSIEINCTQLQENTDKCQQAQANVTVIQSNPIQSNPYPKVASAINCYQKYGELQNVILTETEYQKLITKMGEKNTKDYIESLSLYMKSNGKKYKSHYAVILTWQRNDDKKNAKNKSTSIPRSHKHGEYTSKDSADMGLKP